MNLTMNVKDLYLENCKTLKKKLQKIQVSGSIYHVHEQEELALLICPYYPKQSLPIAYFTELEQVFQKFIRNHKRPQIATAMLRKKNKVGRIMLSDMKLYYKATGIKTGWYWHKNRHMEQNRKSRNKPMPLWSIIFDKEGKNIEQSKGSLFNK